MKILRRWTQSVISSFDAAISQVENQEALVDSAIAGVAKALARAKVQAKRVAADDQKLCSRSDELRQKKDLWEERARKAAEDDEPKALECLRRRNLVVRELKTLATYQKDHANTRRRIDNGIQALEQRLSHLKAQRNLFRTRESSAQALQAVQSNNFSSIDDLEDVFERWDIKISETELGCDTPGPDTDQLEQEFLSVEEELELKEQLKDLCGSPPNSRDPSA